MQYKTITLGLIQDRPELYERLRRSKRLLPTMESYATELKAGHAAWMEQISRQRPGSDPRVVAAEALELAIRDLRDRLPSGPSKDGAEPTPDAAATPPTRPTPPE